MFKRHFQSIAPVAAGLDGGERLSEAEFEAVLGGQAQPPSPGQAIRDAGRSWVDLFAPIVTPIEKTGEAMIEVGNWVRYQAEHVPSLGLSEREIDGYQARLHEAHEQSEKANAHELERLISGDKATTKEEVGDYLHTIAGSGGSGGAPPANDQPYGGETSPSFPANMVNAPPPHEAVIETEQVGPTDAHPGGGTGRLY
ncbi:MAG TPA: hypothetical protein VG963_27505 [Polyangiaceae bacterium]|nr:hypothetical protein [Polyangiaceae bacterium]